MSLKRDENFQQLLVPAVKELASMFESNGFDLRIAGGAPRDLLLAILPHDIDFATTATPTQMVQMFDTNGIRMINTNGLKHGTVTVHMNDENYEITTLRIDRVTDGRHAEVEFTTDWRVDANRRDLTINSMFLTFDGDIIDFFNGQDDLHARCVRFVGNPVERIQEDYLRILRYFRFYSRICLSGHDHCQAHLTAISDNSAGLASISGERIWCELYKIVDQRFNFEFLDYAYKLDFAQYIGLPADGISGKAQNYQKISEHKNTEVMTKVACLLDKPEDVVKLDSRLKVSKADFSLAIFLVTLRNRLQSPDGTLSAMDEAEKLNYYMKLKARLEMNLFGFQEIHKRVSKYEPDWAIQLAIFMDETPLIIEAVSDFKLPSCDAIPTARELASDFGIGPGPLIGIIANRLKNAWIDSLFTYTRADLIPIMDTIKETLRSENKMDDQGNFIKPKKREPATKKKKIAR